MSRVLLTSFEPFGGYELNSSHEVGRAVAAAPPDGVVLDWLALPVVAGLCVDRAWERIEAFRPELVVALGQAGGYPAVCLEERGNNLDDFRAPDNGGNQPRNRPIVADGPPFLRTPAPIDRLLAELPRAGVEVLHSLSAGRYVCNHLYYGLLHRAGGGPPRVLFVHLPLLPEQCGAARLPALPLGRMADAVRLIIRLCVE